MVYTFVIERKIVVEESKNINTNDEEKRT